MLVIKYAINVRPPPNKAYGSCVLTWVSKSHPDAIADTALVSDIGEQ
tara:strand:+ start:969 stop:1109 length:141 start_codon:yes stop_codon:yes gene_type:complete